MERPVYSIYVVRVNDKHEVIDKVLIGIKFNYDDAFDAFERFIREEGHFQPKLIQRIMKNRRKKRVEKSFTKIMITNENLHGYLGPGGYLIQKERG